MSGDQTISRVQISTSVPSNRKRRTFLVGTRGSPLALWQATHVRDRLIVAWDLDGAEVGLRSITTSGDRLNDRALRDFGGKGLFTKEIDEALLNGGIDFAVHSMKDLPTQLPHGIITGAVLERGDVRDAYISSKADSITSLPEGAVVGTSSLRRQAQVRRIRPDLEVVDLRGNVETRLAKLDRGLVDATLLSFAGLKRLGLAHHATSIMPTEEMLPAVAQGAIGVVCRVDDTETRRLLQALDDHFSAAAVACERAFLAELDGSCRTPIAGLAEITAGVLGIRGLVIKPDGTECHEVTLSAEVADALSLGRSAGKDLLGRAGSHFLAHLYRE